MVFGRKKKNQTAESVESVDAAEVDSLDPRAEGPWDVSEIDSRDGYIDLGSILIKPTEGVGLRLEVDEKTKRPRAVNLDVAGSTAQIQAFAAPKSSGLWDEIRKDLKDSLARNNGAPESVEGTFGTELRARFPAKTSDGTDGYRPARFVGIDGPRWFLRTVISGAAAIDVAASKTFDEIIRGIVVVRGNDPMPPRDLLPLTVPDGAHRASGSRATRRAALRNSGQSADASARVRAAGKEAAARQTAEQNGGSGALQPPERGPEVTEIR